MPNRVLKESIRTNEKIDSLTWFEECLYYRLIVSADDYGCFDGRINVIKNTLFPVKDNVTKKSVSDAISKLVNVGLLQYYVVDDKPYLFLPTWGEHQRIRNKHRKYPEPNENILSANCCQMSADCHPESNPIQSNPKPIQSKYFYARETRANTKKFNPPKFEDVAAYCAERGNDVDPKTFLDYFSASGWVDSLGRPVKNWKQKIITWERSGWSGTDKQKHTRDDMERNHGKPKDWGIKYDE